MVGCQDQLVALGETMTTSAGIGLQGLRTKPVAIGKQVTPPAAELGCISSAILFSYPLPERSDIGRLADRHRLEKPSSTPGPMVWCYRRLRAATASNRAPAPARRLLVTRQAV